MIYTKSANFSTPILRNGSNDYENSIFEVVAKIKENTDSYILDIDINIGSEYLKDLIDSKKAELRLIFSSVDKRSYPVSSYDNCKIELKKDEVYIGEKAELQMMIMSKEKISFKNNYDLNSFYRDFLDHIKIEKGKCLGISNVQFIKETGKKGLQIFLFTPDKNIKSEVEYIIKEDVIEFKYRNPEFVFKGIRGSDKMMYPFIYMGLQKALMCLILEYGGGRGFIDLTDIEPSTHLEVTLVKFMLEKNIYSLDVEYIDSVISKITENIISKYARAIRNLGGLDDESN